MSIVQDDMISFGYEYETLVELTSSLVKSDFEKICQQLEKLFNLQCYPDKDLMSRATRIFMANMLNINDENKPGMYTDAKRLFRATPAYGINPCSLDTMNYEAGSSWIVEHDSSVRLLQQKSVEPSNYLYLTPSKWIKKTRFDYTASSADIILENLEFVSPILKLKDILDSNSVVQTVYAKQFNKNGMRFLNNTTTSNHLHYSIVNKIGGNSIEYFRDVNILKRICLAWLYFEPVFLRICPWWRRNNAYCKPMRQILTESLSKKHDIIKELFIAGCEHGILEELDNVHKVIMFFQGDPKDKSNRYAAFNLMNLVDGGIGTIEIRIKHGSNDFEELQGWVRFFALFFKTIVNNQDILKLKDESKAILYGAYDFPNTINTCVDIMFNMLMLTPMPMLSTSVEELEALKTFIKKQISTCNITRSQVFLALSNKNTGDMHNFQNQPDSMDYEMLPVYASTLYNYDTESNDLMQHGGAIETRKPVFSYGSNSAEQLQHRTGAHCLTPYSAFIDNWTRVFAGNSRIRSGGIASIYPFKGGRVYGAVYELTDKEISVLDGYEVGYTRTSKYVQVRHADGTTKRKRCYVYIRNNSRWESAPSVAYMQAIRNMLDDVNKSSIKSKILIRGVLFDDKTGKESLVNYGYFKDEVMTLFTKPKLVEISPKPNNTKKPMVE